jgi:branched-subunit amino acid ABC-type transport system permease component
MARKIIIYSIRDHLLARIANLKTAYEMYDALKNMFGSNNTLRALTLKGQLQNIKMTKADIVAIFFMKISLMMTIMLLLFIQRKEKE